jgi:glycosyltransferase involved in cell wall biosynthesis
MKDHVGGQSPAVSVVMPVHNGMPYLDDSIGSIVAQTLEDFELLILENGSTDGSAAVIQDWARRDRRIRVFQRPQVVGHVASSNLITSQATAPLVARMDADDISHPDRLRRQRAVMEEDADVVLVGTLCDGIDSRGRRARPRDRWRVIGSSTLAPFPHGSSMFRRALFDEVGGYREACEDWADQDLFWRLADRGRVVVLPDALYRYRYHLTGTTLGLADEDIVRSAHRRDRCLAERRVGRDYTHMLLDGDGDYPRGRATPAALHSQGALRLWSGQRPGILRALLRSRSAGMSPAALPILLWAAWGSVSPGSLRLAMRGLVRARDWAATIRIKDGRPREWRFG